MFFNPLFKLLQTILNSFKLRLRVRVKALILFILCCVCLSMASSALAANKVDLKAISYDGTIDKSSANLPARLYLNAVTDPVIYDQDFDYRRLNRINSLKIFPQGYRGLKGLVDKVVVYKMRHEMILYKKDQVVRKYWIALSDRPEGDKQYEGDRRTPEGTYTLDYIKEKSYYYKAFHISYPNQEDVLEARRLGRSPGGMIMVHGQPPSNSEYHETVQRSDWTNGCIAILNPEIDEFISLVDPGTTIEINP